MGLEGEEKEAIVALLTVRRRNRGRWTHKGKETMDLANGSGGGLCPHVTVSTEEVGLAVLKPR